MLEKLRIRQCCCGISIRTGSLFIAAFGWLVSMIHGERYETYLTQLNTTVKQLPNTTEVDIEEINRETVHDFTLTISLISLILSISLAVGICKEDRRFMIPWLFVKFIEMFSIHINTCLKFISSPIYTILLMLLLSAGYTYCYLVVWSCFLDLGEKKLNDQPENDPEVQTVETGFNSQYNEWKQQQPLSPQSPP